MEISIVRTKKIEHEEIGYIYSKKASKVKDI
jgi:hypothetical protein